MSTYFSVQSSEEAYSDGTRTQKLRELLSLSLAKDAIIFVDFRACMMVFVSKVGSEFGLTSSR